MSARRFRHGALAALAFAVAVVAPASGATTRASAASSAAGSQGTDTSLPTTSSAVTVSGRGAFSALSITVNQTADLVNQAISVSWTGGAPTFSNAATGAFNSTFNGNYLQMFECWGDPSSSDPLTATNPGPSPSQCEFGGESNSPTSAYPIQETGFEYSRVVSQQSWTDYPTAPGWVDTTTGFKVLPFDAVDGTEVDQQANYNYLADPLHPTAFWLDPYFSFNTSNEIAFARTYPNGGTGSGQQLFQVQTGLEAPGLGCGQKLQAVAGHGTKVPKCWLVIVPRSTPVAENPAGLSGVQSVVTSPLSPSAWANRIAIPLDFRPIDNSCTIGAQERRVVGSELATSAFVSWEPALCKARASTPYNYSYLSDDQARENLTAPAFGDAGLSVFSTPPTSPPSGSSAAVYAPLTLSSVVVGFNVERVPVLQPDGQLEPSEVPLSGIRVAHLQLTPRLVAKLLTESYQAQLVDVLATKPANEQWVLANPTTLVTDPDFVQFNPEFALLATQQAVDASGLVVEQPSSDAAQALWRWVLADPEARAWLDGTPDPWGMQVNPLYSTNRAHNTNGVAFGTPAPSTYPKSDPYCFDAGEVVGSPAKPARPICILDWSPYALTMQAASQAVGTSNSGARTTLDPTGTPETAWKANGPQKAGTRFIMSITDSASATRYGLQTASLSRAGDDTAQRTFVAPSTSAVLAAVASMKASAPTGMLVTDPVKVSAGAYPLSMLTYAATIPAQLSAAERTDYAALLAFATGSGQVSGTGIGQLPGGYVPLPASLRRAAVSAIAAILHPPAPTPPPTTTPSTTPDTQPASGSGPGSTPSSTDAPTTAPSSPSSTTATTAAAVHPPTSKRPSLLTQLVAAGPVRFAVPVVGGLGLLALAAAPFAGPRRRRVRRRPVVRPRAAIARFRQAGDRSPSRNVFEPW